MIQIIRIIISPVLLPVSLIYLIATSIRNLFYNTGLLNSYEFGIPLISVGNITVGGTGKTPVVEHLVRILKNDYRIAVLSRGYKRKTKGFRLVQNQSSFEEVGDEPKQIKSNFPDITVAVDEQRKHGIEKLMQLNQAPEVIILDDAYQHRKVKPGLSILLIDFNKPLYRDFILPLGNLRESPNQKRRADITVITKCPQSLERKGTVAALRKNRLSNLDNVFTSTVEYGNLEPIVTDRKLLTQKISRVVLVTGIANPDNLSNHVKQNISDQITHLAFKDHHVFTNKDLTRIQRIYNSFPEENKIIITTQKDAFRLIKFINIVPDLFQYIYFIPIQVKFNNLLNGNTFNNEILKYVRKDYSNS